MRYVQTFKAKGRVYHYFRAGGVKQRLPDDPSSPEFQARYRELLETVEIQQAGANPGSIAALMRDYRASPEFAGLGPKTKISYARALHSLAMVETCRVVDLKRIHVLKIRDSLADRPRTADLFVQVTRAMLSWAVDRGYLEVHPLLRVSRINEPVSHTPWSEDHCAAFEASDPPQALMTAYMLGRYTGQRRGDVLKMTRTRYDGAGLELVQGKTGQALWIPAHERLKAYLDALPADRLLFVTTARGSAWHEDSFTHAFGDHLSNSGLHGLTFHGLRHTAATCLAEAGCSDREIMAITGHRTASMVSRYTDKADQRRRASAAILKMERR